MRLAGTDGMSMYSLLLTAATWTLAPFSLPLGCFLILLVTELIKPVLPTCKLASVNNGLLSPWWTFKAIWQKSC